MRTDLDDHALVVTWIEPWLRPADDPAQWRTIDPAVRALVTLWLLHVHSFRGGAASFVENAAPWVQAEVDAACDLLDEPEIAALWRDRDDPVDALEPLDQHLLDDDLDARLLAWLREHMGELPAPPDDHLSARPRHPP